MVLQSKPKLEIISLPKLVLEKRKKRSRCLNKRKMLHLEKVGVATAVWWE